MDKLPFTVVTPNYNMAGYLGKTIESVLQNLEPGDQYFIVDGGSSDGSVAVIEQYAPSITGWISEPDAGYADALARGFARASAPLQCWVNSGDLLLKGALRQARRHFQTADTDMIFGDDFYIDEDDRVIWHSHGRVASLADMMLFGGWTPLQDACFWRRSLYERVGGIDAALRYAADFDLFLRFSLEGACRYVPTVFSAFRRHDRQKSIRDAVHYRGEREQCRRRQLHRLALNAAVVKWRELYFGLAVRWRARVSEPLRRSRALAGESVTEISCATYS